ncbi:CidA/LrgA family protein [Methylocella tundrae]|uniref:CidA/LrgA family protein n=1 Tax=Methylocella tundrae TaxID=227605 RepID=A0A8B6M5S0_METTU|nr:CidA/LrgA family protein [Methylocella tundrae]VTZ25983.1 CidA/LrgA family protein [Methylocella tundrae]VTZ50126.1 CidA/LrgA family protein [Methylocella tundrae]
MHLRKTFVRIRYAFHRSRLLQLGVLMAFWALGQATVQLVHLPVPGGVVGMAAVLALLLTRRMNICSVRRGAEWLLAEMLLFFVPAVMALLDHSEFLGVLGLKLLIVILTGTLCVMAATALTVEMCARWTMRRVAE